MFFDPTGRRWRRIKWGGALVAVFAIAAVAISWGPVHRAPTLGAHGRAAPAVNLGNFDSRPPVIGTGPLVRLVRLDHRPDTVVAVDVVSGQDLGAITPDDADTAGDSPYAVQRYGYSSTAHKTISLTFDDGPDPVWTPKILDVLGRNKVPSTFFVIGKEAVKFPDIVRREAREGHTVGDHTMTHPDLKPDQAGQEIVPTDRIEHTLTGVQTNLFRLPYDGNTTGANDGGARTLVEAERLHYIVSVEDFDTNDWQYGKPETRPATPIPFPPTDQDNITILLHDGGGNRAETVAYLERLIPWARAHGYTFHSLPQVSPPARDGTTDAGPSVWDRETFWYYRAVYSWPNQLLNFLFVLAIASVVVGGLVNVMLALFRRFRYRRRFAGWPDDFAGPEVSVVLAAYNEEKVLGRTLASLGRTWYGRVVEILVIDDGSTDRTAEVVLEAARSDRRIRLIQQENAGKAAALNRGFAQAVAPVVVTLDADTLFAPGTIGNLVRHFAADRTGRLAAVAGVVKVGNARNLLTRWQALEYVTQIGVDRGAQDALHAIMVVPGACAAWRRDAVEQAGGYSRATLAEDCDLALDLQRLGYSVTQDDEAACYTEAPQSPRTLTQQRFRWMFGNIQAMWKHRTMILNPKYRWLGMLTLPSAVISILLPIVFLPFVYLMAVITIQGQGVRVVLLYAALFMSVQLATAAAGIWLTKESPKHLLMVPIYRLIYEPLRAYLLYKSLWTVLRGTRSSWHKLARMGTARAQVEKVGARR
ncbi:MAG TPA: glycosyltransferase [Micromonosporaceae bacterium]